MALFGKKQEYPKMFYDIIQHVREIYYLKFVFNTKIDNAGWQNGQCSFILGRESIVCTFTV